MKSSRTAVLLEWSWVVLLQTFQFFNAKHWEEKSHQRHRSRQDEQKGKKADQLALEIILIYLWLTEVSIWQCSKKASWSLIPTLQTRPLKKSQLQVILPKLKEISPGSDNCSSSQREQTTFAWRLFSQIIRPWSTKKLTTLFSKKLMIRLQWYLSTGSLTSWKRPTRT